MKRVVFDTNVSIASFFWNGYPRKIYELCKSKEIKLFYSREILEELIRVLAYKKFGLTTEEILPIANDFITTAQVVNATSQINVITQDPTDNIFLECAQDSRADFIISGDYHLLDLKKHHNIQIIKPKDFYTKILHK